MYSGIPVQYEVWAEKHGDGDWEICRATTADKVTDSEVTAIVSTPTTASTRMADISDADTEFHETNYCIVTGQQKSDEETASRLSNSCTVEVDVVKGLRDDLDADMLVSEAVSIGKCYGTDECEVVGNQSQAQLTKHAHCYCSNESDTSDSSTNGDDDKMDLPEDDPARYAGLRLRVDDSIIRSIFNQPCHPSETYFSNYEWETLQSKVVFSNAT